jgi:hypothetical protein
MQARIEHLKIDKQNSERSELRQQASRDGQGAGF